MEWPDAPPPWTPLRPVFAKFFAIVFGLFGFLLVSAYLLKWWNDRP